VSPDSDPDGGQNSNPNPNPDPDPGGITRLDDATVDRIAAGDCRPDT